MPGTLLLADYERTNRSELDEHLQQLLSPPAPPPAAAPAQDPDLAARLGGGAADVRQELEDHLQGLIAPAQAAPAAPAAPPAPVEPPPAAPVSSTPTIPPPPPQPLQLLGEGLTSLGSGAQNVREQLTNHLTSLLQPQPVPPAAAPAPAQDPDLAARLGGAAPGSTTAASGTYQDYARQAATRSGIDPDVFVRQIQQESGFNPSAKSPAGATGIAQFMPGTAAGMGIDPTDPYASLDAGARLMAAHLKQYGGDYAKALAAYNAGPGNVDKYGGVPPFEETQRYVKTILGGAGQAVSAAVNAARGTLGQVSQFGDSQLTASEAAAACGPAAAVRFAQRFGRNPTLREATDLAGTVGWTQGQGMAGIGSEKALLDKMGVATRLVQGADWGTFADEARTGNPVIISTAGHYFTADNWDPATNRFHVGRSGLDLKGGAEWMTPEQMTNAMGAVQGGLLADNPTTPSSTAAPPKPGGFTAPGTPDQQMAQVEPPKPLQLIGEGLSSLGSGAQGGLKVIDDAIERVKGAAAPVGEARDVLLQSNRETLPAALDQAGTLLGDTGLGQAIAENQANPPLAGVREQIANAPVLGGALGMARGPMLLSDEEVLRSREAEPARQLLERMNAAEVANGRTPPPITDADVVETARTGMIGQAVAMTGEGFGRPPRARRPAPGKTDFRAPDLPEAPVNPHRLEQAPPTPDAVPLTSDELADHFDALNTRHDEIADEILSIQEQLVAGRGQQPKRPPWAAGYTNDALMTIARQHGVSAFEESWWDKVGLTSGSGELRENVGQSGLRGTGKKLQTPTELRAQLRELEAEQQHLLEAANDLTAADDTAAFYRRRVADDLPFEYPAGDVRATPGAVEPTRPREPVGGGEAAPGEGQGAAPPGTDPDIGGAPERVSPAAPVGRPGLSALEAARVEQRAGNILLPKFVQEPVRDLIAETYRADPARFEAAKRGTMTNDEIRELAEQTGTKVKRITDLWQPGQAKNAETLHAMRQGLADRALRVRAAQQALKEAPNSLDARATLIEALTQHAAIQEAVQGVTGEAGRALGALRLPVQGEEASLRLLQRLAKEKGLTPAEMAEQLTKVNLDDPTNVAVLARQLSSHTLMDQATALWYFSLLSNPMTHIKNTVSNALVTVTRPLESLASAGVDVARYGAERALRRPGARRERFFGEVPEQLFGYASSLPDGLKSAYRLMRTGVSEKGLANPELAGRAEPFSGRLADLTVNVPGRALQASDQVFRGMHTQASLRSLAYRQARQEGLRGQDLADRIVEIITNPSQKLVDAAADEGAYRVFQQGGDFVNAMGSLREKAPALKVPLPFVQTPYNVAKYALERTPLGLVKAGMDRQGGGVLSDRLARAGLGTATMMYFLDKARDGTITGAAPRDPTERDAFFRQGKQPYSIKVGDTWRSYQSLQPLTTLLGAVAGYAEAEKSAGQSGADQMTALGAGGLAMGRALVDQPWLQGMSDLIDLTSGTDVRNPDDVLKTVNKYMQQQATSVVPSIVKAVARAQDPTLRDPEEGLQGIPQAIAANIPGLQENTPPKLTAWGAESKRAQSGPGVLFDPTMPSPETTSPLELELDRLQKLGYDVQPGFVTRRVTAFNTPVKLTEEEQRQYQRLAGSIAQELLETVVGSPEWEALADKDKVETIQKTTDRVRSKVREALQPGLLDRAVEGQMRQARQHAGISETP